MDRDALHAEVLALLRTEYGLDGERGGMSRTLARYLGRRLRELDVEVGVFYERLRGDEDERGRLLHSVTVGHSWFFRDPGQLDELRQKLAALRENDRRRPLQIWIAGCATGEEAWTVAFIAAELDCSFTVLATDIDGLGLDRARAGVYGRWTLRELPEPLRVRYLESAGPDSWRIVDALRERVEFAEHNLCTPPPPPAKGGGWDLICCRNVLIYFERERAAATVAGLRASLGESGQLFLGVGDLLFQLDEIDGLSRGQGRPLAAALESRARAPRAAVESRALVRKPTESLALVHEPAGPSLPPSTSGPTGVREQLRRAGEAVETGQAAEAKRMLETMLADDPTIAEALLWLGVVHHLEGEPQAASEALRRARCMDPSLWPATLFAALNAERLGRWPAATRCWSDLARALEEPDREPVNGSEPLQRALPRWRAEARDLVRQRGAKPF